MPTRAPPRAHPHLSRTVRQEAPTRAPYRSPCVAAPAPQGIPASLRTHQDNDVADFETGSLERPHIQRHRTRIALVGGIPIGGGSPIVVQSMTNTDTADVAATVAQVKALAYAGPELVRLTVNTAEAAAAVAPNRARPERRGCHRPLIGDVHFTGPNPLASVSC